MPWHVACTHEARSGASLQRSVSLLAPALGRMLGPLHLPAPADMASAALRDPSPHWRLVGRCPTRANNSLTAETDGHRYSRPTGQANMASLKLTTARRPQPCSSPRPPSAP